MAVTSLTCSLSRLPLFHSVSLSCRFISPLFHSAPPPCLISTRFSTLSASLLDLEQELQIATDLPEQQIATDLPDQQIATDLPEQQIATDLPDQPEKMVPLRRYPVPKLTVKEKKELASYAQSLGKKLKYQQVGKSGVTSSLATSFIQTLEANELLKLKVHGNCPEDFLKAIKLLEESTGSVAVHQIGRSVILYRPSLSKRNKEEEARNNALSNDKRKSFKKPPPDFQSKENPGFRKVKSDEGYKTKSFRKPWSNNANSFNVGSRRRSRAAGSRNPN